MRGVESVKWVVGLTAFPSSNVTVKWHDRFGNDLGQSSRHSLSMSHEGGGTSLRIVAIISDTITIRDMGDYYLNVTFGDQSSEFLLMELFVKAPPEIKSDAHIDELYPFTQPRKINFSIISYQLQNFSSSLNVFFLKLLSRGLQIRGLLQEFSELDYRLSEFVYGKFLHRIERY